MHADAANQLKVFLLIWYVTSLSSSFTRYALLNFVVINSTFFFLVNLCLCGVSGINWQNKPMVINQIGSIYETPCQFSKRLKTGGCIC